MFNLCLKEARQLWREQRLPTLYVLLFAAALIALGGTMRTNRMESRQSAHAASAEYERWLNQGEKYAHAAAHYGIYVFRPVYGMANLDPGVQAFVGHSVWLEAHLQNGLLYRPMEDGTASERLGSFSPAFLLLTLLPLFIILLGHGGFAAERERGTLRLALIHVRRIRHLMLSKLLVMFGASALPVTFLFAVAAVFASVWRMQEPPSQALRWGALLLLYLTLVLIWTLATIGISALARTSAQALVILLSLWCVLSVVVPRAAAELAAIRHPSPTQQQLATNMATALGDVEGGDREKKVQERLLLQYHLDSLDKLPINWEGVLRNEGEAAGDKIFDRFWGQLFTSYRLQQTDVAHLSLLSPTLASTWLSARFASTDIQAHLGFVEAAEAHRRRLETILNDQIEQKLVDPTVLRPNSGKEVWRRVPPFHFTGLSLWQTKPADAHGFLFALGGLSLHLFISLLLVLIGARQLKREIL